MTSLTDRTLVISPNNGSIKQEITNHDVLTILLFKIFINTAFYYVSIFMPIGLLCNALLFLVFAAVDKRRPNLTNHNQHPISATFLLNASNRGRHFDNHDVNNYAVPIISVTPSSRVYYKAIAYGELGTMLFKDLWWLWLGVGWPGVLGIDPLGLANPKASSAPKWLCPLSLYLWFVHETIANNCFVLLQLERVVALYHPLRARAFLKTRPALKANVAVGLVALIAIVLCITIFGFARAQPIIPVNAVSADHADLIQNIKVECVFAGAAFWSNFSLLDYMANYIFPAFMSIACSILISVKILCRRQRLSVHVAGCNTHITASEISVCVTLMLMSCAHFIFYVPLTVFRAAYVVVPRTTWESMGPETHLQLLALGLELYALVAPVHVATFALCVLRVPGFAKRLVYIVKCKWYKTNIHQNLSQINNDTSQLHPPL